MTSLEQRLAAAAPPADDAAAIAAAYAAGRRDAARSSRPWQLATAASLAICLALLNAHATRPTPPQANRLAPTDARDAAAEPGVVAGRVSVRAALGRARRRPPRH